MLKLWKKLSKFQEEPKRPKTKKHPSPPPKKTPSIYHLKNNWRVLDSSDGHHRVYLSLLLMCWEYSCLCCRFNSLSWPCNPCISDTVCSGNFPFTNSTGGSFIWGDSSAQCFILWIKELDGLGSSCKMEIKCSYNSQIVLQIKLKKHA